jgi:hypothetical protein
MFPNGVLSVKPKGKRSAIGYLVTEVGGLARAGAAIAGPLLKDYSFVPIQQDAVFHMPADGAGQDNLLDVAAFLNEIVDGVAMVDADNILFDDGAIVEYLSDVVGGSANQFDAALERLVVGLGADECRQKRMMNVDEIRGADGGDELVREHLHVARQDDETTAMIADKCDLLQFRLPFAFFCDRDDEVGNAVEVCDTLVVRMVGNDQRNFAAEFAALVAVEKILQAVVILRNEDGNAGATGGMGEPPVHLEVVRDGSKVLGKLGKIKIKVGRVELHSCKKEIGFGISMLIVEQDVAVVAKDEIGNGGNDSFAVGAGDEKDGGVVHG